MYMYFLIARRVPMVIVYKHSLLLRVYVMYNAAEKVKAECL